MLNIGPVRLAILVLLLTVTQGCKTSSAAPGDKSPPGPRIMYTRCNLRPLKGVYIAWNKLQLSPIILPLGTKVEITGGPVEWTLRDVRTEKIYTLHIGAAGESYLLKFLSPNPPVVRGTPEQVACIERGIAVIGMTKTQAYQAMGPPTYADLLSTGQFSMEAILDANLWVYHRGRWRKKIGIRFGGQAGLVNHTESMPK